MGIRPPTWFGCKLSSFKNEMGLASKVWESAVLNSGAVKQGTAVLIDKCPAAIRKFSCIAAVHVCEKCCISSFNILVVVLELFEVAIALLCQPRIFPYTLFSSVIIVIQNCITRIDDI